VLRAPSSWCTRVELAGAQLLTSVEAAIYGRQHPLTELHDGAFGRLDLEDRLRKSRRPRGNIKGKATWG
jgi:hypothetical protein